jgi:hypothetical protein
MLVFDAPSQVRRRYLRGHCHSLALALAQLSGWSVVIHSGISGNLSSLAHCLVKTPQGLYLDIAGLRTARQVKDQAWWFGDLHEVAAADLVHHELYFPDVMHAPEPEQALPVAQQLLQWLSTQPEEALESLLN